MAVKPIPDGYHTATPYLIVKSAAQAIEFYMKAFGAAELFRLPGPNGGVVHAEIKIGDSPIMLADECVEMGALAPAATNGRAFSLMLYVPDVDTQFQKAVAAGATVQRPIENQFYGDRSGTVADPFGHVWTLSTHIEDVSQAEMDKRFAKLMAEHAGK